MNGLHSGGNIIIFLQKYLQVSQRHIRDFTNNDFKKITCSYETDKEINNGKYVLMIHFTNIKILFSSYLFLSFLQYQFTLFFVSLAPCY